MTSLRSAPFNTEVFERHGYFSMPELMHFFLQNFRSSNRPKAAHSIFYPFLRQRTAGQCCLLVPGMTNAFPATKPTGFLMPVLAADMHHLKQVHGS